ncbi:hypothetical protein ACGE24_06540 [Corynebacterium kroppenstedtii]|uniref:hypothetical protein n=1 Tax=Corynebacterium sp. PCR 32 TaxID=3351342 RepID=UPI0030A9AF17
MDRVPHVVNDQPGHKAPPAMEIGAGIASIILMAVVSILSLTGQTSRIFLLAVAIVTMLGWISYLRPATGH